MKKPPSFSFFNRYLSVRKFYRFARYAISLITGANIRPTFLSTKNHKTAHFKVSYQVMVHKSEPFTT